MSEVKIDVGPDYRVYFGKDGTEIVILLAGGTTQARWQDYKRRKAGGM